MPKATQNKKNQHLCLICFNPKQNHLLINLSCGCSACVSCLTSWILVRIAEFPNSTDSPIPCITSECPHSFQIEDIRPYLPKSSLSQIDNALLRIYLSKDQSIRRCPNSKCAYAGVIDVSSHCGQNLICAVCQTQWRDPKQFSRVDLLLECLQQGIRNKNEIFSACWKWFKAKECPQCRTPIEKNGGCPSMTCKQCNATFCWDCLALNDKHYNSVHYYQEHTKPLLFFLFLLLALVVSLWSLYQIPFVTSITNSLVSWIPENVTQRILWILSMLGQVIIAMIFDSAFRTRFLTKSTVPDKYAKQKKRTSLVIMLGCAGVMCWCEIYKNMAIIECFLTIGRFLVRKDANNKNPKYVTREVEEELEGELFS